MKFANFLNKSTFKNVFGSIGMKLTAARPDIMLVLGGVSVLGGTVYACVKTEKAKEVVKKTKDDIKKVDETLKLPDEDSGIDVLPETRKQMKVEKGHQLTKIYIHTAYEMIKIYGIPAILWFGGMGLIFGSHGELKKTNANLIANSIAGKKLFDEYRERVAKAVGEETENKIFMGAQEEKVKVLEKDPETGEEKIVEKKADVFYAQPGSIFARNFTEETSDAFDVRSFADYYLDSRIDSINKDLSLGVIRAITGMDVLRRLGFNENALTERFDDDDGMQQLLTCGISGNARKVQDPEMRKLKVTRLRGYKKLWDQKRNMEVYVPCLRLDFNFYPLAGMI